MPTPSATERSAALEEFMAGLRRLRERAGEPSFRRMAARSGAVSHATLHLTVTGHRLQPWETVREFVRACGGDEAEWHARWQATDEALCTAQQHADGAEDAAEDAADVQAVAAGEPPRRRARWLLAALAACVTAVAVVVAVTLVRDDASGQQPAAPPRGPVHPGDASDFIGDVTYPDGTLVRPGEQFVKVWEIRNSGSVPWQDRYLRRTGLPIENGECHTPERVPINDTAPQQRARISVTVRAPSAAPVDCKVYWKMVDESGRVLLPGYRPIFFEVRVRR